MGTFQFKLPELGEGIHEGEIVKWLVEVGDKVEEDQAVVEVQNDKANVEVPSPVDGTVSEIVVEEGTICVVGDTLITFEVKGDVSEEEENEADDEVFHDEPTDESSIKADDETAHPDDDSSIDDESRKTSPTGMVLAMPAVRKYARAQEIDLTQVKGSASNGRITKQDVQQFTEGKKQNDVEINTDANTKDKAELIQATDEKRVAIKGVRKRIAEAMVKSVYTAPHVTIHDEVIVSKLVSYREEIKALMEQKGIKITYLPFIVKACVVALKQFPELNASIDDEKQEVIYKYDYHLGIATDTDKGLIVPVIKQADRKNVWTYAQEILDMSTRAREGKLDRSEMTGGTFTITNIGSAGGQFFTPIINHPEVAILGTGRIAEKPVVQDGVVQAAHVMALSLSFDHRLIDGAAAQHFMNKLKQLLEDPQMLIIEG